jgi:hypothetical protein
MVRAPVCQRNARVPVTAGDPPALPGRHAKFDSSGSVTSHCLRVRLRSLQAGVSQEHSSHPHCLELVVLTLGRDQAPLRVRDP